MEKHEMTLKNTPRKHEMTFSDAHRREIITDRIRVWYQHGYDPAYIAKTLGVTEFFVKSILALEAVESMPEPLRKPEFIEPTSEA